MADATCIHEAAHAAVALHLGLPLRRVQVKGWVRLPRYCAQLYPGVVAGVPIRTPICLLQEDCLDTDPFQVLVAMTAPSFVPTEDRKINTYAMLEALLAHRYAGKHGLRPARVTSRAQQSAAICEPSIYEIAARLEEEGVIDGADLSLPLLRDEDARPPLGAGEDQAQAC